MMLVGGLSFLAVPLFYAVVLIDLLLPRSHPLFRRAGPLRPRLAHVMGLTAVLAVDLGLPHLIGSDRRGSGMSVAYACDIGLLLSLFALAVFRPFSRIGWVAVVTTLALIYGGILRFSATLAR